MIPLSIPHIAGNEWKYVKDCLDTGWVSMAGAYVDKFEKIVAEYAGAKYGVAAVNGTAALDISLKLVGVERDDYVIVPNITFIASANAVKYQSANPIFVDIDPKTWQMDLDLLEQFLERETYQVCTGKSCHRHLKSTHRRVKAIMPVHVLGNMLDMKRLVKVSKKYHLEIVEDASESLGSYYDGKHSGTFGKIGVFSFNGNKIITTGGGGVIVTNNKAIAKRAKHLTTQAKKNPADYFHDEIGYNYRMVNVLAAMGVAQMEQLPSFIKQKKHIDRFYRKELQGVGDITFQNIPIEVDFNGWLITIKTSKQKKLIKYLNNNGVMCRPFWYPMNQLPMFVDDLYIQENDFSRNIHQTCLSIPSSVGLTEKQLKTVVKTIKDFYKKK